MTRRRASWRRVGAVNLRGSGVDMCTAPCLPAPPSRRHSCGQMHMADPRLIFQHKHLLGIEGLQPYEIQDLLDRADGYVALNRQADKKLQVLKGLTQINLLLREQHPHPDQLRARRQAAGGRRGQHGGGELGHEEGRDADRHGDDAQRHAPRRAGRAPSGQRGGGSCWRDTCAARSSTPATARTSIRPRRCSTR